MAEIILDCIKPLRLGHEWFHSWPALTNTDYLHLMMKLGMLSDYVSQELRRGLQRGEYLSPVMSNLFVHSLSNHIEWSSTEGQFLLLQPEAWTKQALDPALAARCQAYKDVMLALRDVDWQGLLWKRTFYNIYSIKTSLLFLFRTVAYPKYSLRVSLLKGKSTYRERNI